MKFLDLPIEVILKIADHNEDRSLHRTLIRSLKSYKEYLASEVWEQTKARYFSSDKPKKCLACDNPKFQLHHLSYARIGEELLGDLVSLCGDCHSKVHSRLKGCGTHLQHTHAVLREIFGWSIRETQRRFKAFRGEKGFLWLPKKIS